MASACFWSVIDLFITFMAAKAEATRSAMPSSQDWYSADPSEVSPKYLCMHQPV